jgi:predicted amidohydrolase YtcJ
MPRDLSLEEHSEMSLRVRGLLVALFACFPGLLSADDAADLLLLRGRVWTAEANPAWAEAVAVRGGRIAAVGTTSEVEALRGPKTEVIHLGGRLVLPGFDDAHVHLLDGAISLDQVDLAELSDVGQIQARIKGWARGHRRQPWVVGGGWAYGSFPGGLPTRQQLDAVVSDRPAFLESYDTHTAWVNSRALALAGISRSSKDPAGGTIVRDPKTGEPTGVLKEKPAVDLVKLKVPRPGPGETYEALLKGLRLLNSFGITSVQDAGLLSPEQDVEADLAMLDRARREGKLSVRVAAAIDLEPGKVEATVAEAKKLAARYRDETLRVVGVKLFVDGVIESKTAALLEPYAGDTVKGVANWTSTDLNEAVKAADRQGLQTWLHAIGDLGVHMALDAHEAALRANGRLDRRGRIEHVETLAPSDYARFKPLGVIASMQPLHANPDQNVLTSWAGNLGTERASRAWSWAALEKAGARLAFGSDWPVVSPSVQRGLYCAVTRKTKDGTPAGGFLPQHAISLESALRHYTLDAAFASFEEAEKGSLEVGKRADLVVLSEDLFKGPPEGILRAKVLLTLMGGRAVYRDPNF